MAETRSKTWILIDETIAALNHFDYVKVTVSKLTEFDEEISEEAINEKGNHYFYAGKVYSRFGMTLEFYRCFGKPVIKNEVANKINTVKKINDNTFQFIMDNKTSYLVEGITDKNVNHINGDIKTPETLIDWNKSYIDDQGNIIIVLAIYECFDTPYFDVVYSHMQNNLKGFSHQGINRTIYFKIATDNTIKHGIWNLENNQAATEVNFSSFLWFRDLKTWLNEKIVLQLAEIFRSKNH